MEKKYEDRIIGLTGYSSSQIDNDSLARRIIELEGGILAGDSGNNDDWEIEQIIFIGDIDFDKTYLIQSIEVGVANNFTCRYYSVDDFWDVYSENGSFEPYYEGDPRIEEHAGLAFLASLYFKYPDVDIFGFGNRKQNNTGDWKVESILRADFGYSAGKDISEHSRRTSLKNAVESSDKISLKEIAEHLVFLINTRKVIKSMDSAVERWSKDLDWLRKEFYDKSIHSFRFPNPH